ncbi:hypothetical protein GLYMA_13G122733v4 [Glycine max]|nr:hypothetical protein GLYMA_13G122733v4 [Glycine max]KAH1101130.1 hypothetical protein GYH30_035959 [Glycine max]
MMTGLNKQYIQFHPHEAPLFCLILMLIQWLQISHCCKVTDDPSHTCGFLKGKRFRGKTVKDQTLDRWKENDQL